MSEFFDVLETRAPEQRERELMAALPGAIAHAMARSPAIAEQLRGVDPATVDSRAALARLPVLRKHELLERQQHSRDDAAAPAGPVKAFGGFSAIGWGEALRVFASPGPIYEPESARADYWRFARALYAAGFRAGELAYNCFSYHFTPAGSMMETAAHAVGCTVFPGGTGQTEQQVRAIADLAPSGYTGTPSFLKIILEKSRRTRRAAGLAAARAGLGRSLPAVAARLAGRARHRGLPGLWQRRPGHDRVRDAGAPGAGAGRGHHRRDRASRHRRARARRRGRRSGGDHAEPGLSAGALRHGDLSAVLPGVSPCGRTNTRIRGWMGRADQTTKVRGMFVHPSQVADVLRRHPEILRARLVISGTTGADRMVLKTESRVRGEDLAKRIADSLRDLTSARRRGMGGRGRPAQRRQGHRRRADLRIDARGADVPGRLSPPARSAPLTSMAAATTAANSAALLQPSRRKTIGHRAPGQHAGDGRQREGQRDAPFQVPARRRRDHAAGRHQRDHRQRRGHDGLHGQVGGAAQRRHDHEAAPTPSRPTESPPPRRCRPAPARRARSSASGRCRR